MQPAANPEIDHRFASRAIESRIAPAPKRILIKIVGEIRSRHFDLAVLERTCRFEHYNCLHQVEPEEAFEALSALGVSSSR